MRDRPNVYRQRANPDQPHDQHIEHDQHLPQIQVRPFEYLHVPLAEIEQADHAHDVKRLHREESGEHADHAMLAFPAPWKHRVIGVLAGLLAVQALNIVRVISLFYLGQWNMQVFEWAHLYLWQMLIMLDVLIVWLIWIRTLPVNIGPVAHAA